MEVIYKWDMNGNKPSDKNAFYIALYDIQSFGNNMVKWLELL